MLGVRGALADPVARVGEEIEFDVNADGTVTFGISYVKVDDIVAMLDALERALADRRPA
ncbi:hypothetical protein AB0P45_32425 [Streptomyces niveus]|uniref:hypothetical protein n=1 Tax=Streptomyces niveus TaxID=193462 RepID=UPI0034160690